MTGPAPLALSMGEPAGVGPEIIAAAWTALKTSGPVFAVVGDAALLRAQGQPVQTVLSLADAPAVFGRAIPVLDIPLPAAVAPGRPEAANAGAVADWIEQAVNLALSGEASGVVTAPIAKAPLYAAGFRFPGHTEFIAELTADIPFAGTRGPVMMLTAKDLRACLVTIHSPLAEVPALITVERVCRTARVVHEAMKRDFGIAAPRLALAALNPHAGEGGAIGLEEIEVLGPAARALRAEGIAITDPRPADTLFHDDARATYDAVLCLYHDQALIPVKTLDFWGGVNTTLGLPVIRTSPDHGTGFDIAGEGLARADSLIAAVRLAGEMAAARAGVVSG
ncbi:MULTISPECIES: 4-hydroxythreonine-4-phosphate dehydrogenase PdxA [unclassified Brevundimonas]|uniref:4-hydroxythreonine-4-phosphate dehydrogenase PdxA n=1 Tax=unclassified Brevundimonas TaxID=2622653 RepID=UPI0006FCA276|nr:MULTISPECIES: 4-hydroxythreonine-4-phosphate dehydrogenase PdxA [unclassified Brevundimonas]KQY64999.1 4-hydroxythreonine-4-phosphate dehydrogenase [Brevundimonas sp. Root1423]KRA26983.1 4-hydroxythreonine-4-phosphate dehydrogenase [Brevundimonas sp. Root608]